MALQTREFQWAGHSEVRLKNSIPSIVFPSVNNSPDNVIVTYNDDENDGGSNVNDLDYAMSIEGWSPA